MPQTHNGAPHAEAAGTAAPRAPDDGAPMPRAPSPLSLWCHEVLDTDDATDAAARAVAVEALLLLALPRVRLRLRPRAGTVLRAPALFKRKVL